MNKVINTEKIPIKLWLDDIEEGALEQAKNLTNLPFAFKHIAIMPDSHLGYGMPIGGVLATKDVIIPNAVGVDIGCGMCAVKTSLAEINTETLKKIMGEIRKVIPLGPKKHKQEQSDKLMPGICIINGKSDKTIVQREYKNALKSIGTLGGGNHFIEIQKGSDGHIWIMIHSGSRNLGKQIADHYDKIARELNKKWYSEVPDKWELAFLPVNSKEGQSYIREMNYAVEFALANRKLMIDRVIEIFQKELVGFENPETKFNEMINIAHNYARQENHFGKNVWVHRKGATSAREEEIGIIPGSQGTKSYIVKGKGNPESFESCSHGAGRKMGRKQAQRSLSYEEEIKKMGSVIHGMRGEKDLDEAPGSYKDIDVVMQNQKDLVDIVVELSPLAVIKG
jgi:tRNA-splicing ligase RtcB